MKVWGRVRARASVKVWVRVKMRVGLFLLITDHKWRNSVISAEENHLQPGHEGKDEGS